MTSRPVPKSVPDNGAYLFQLPLDTTDIFRVGTQNYQERWFASEVCVPSGVWAWVDRNHLRPYAESLVEHLNIGRGLAAEVQLLVENQRYVLDGPGLSESPAGVPIPMCAPISIDAALRGLATRVRRNEHETLQWLEFFQSQLPGFAGYIRAHPKLCDLMR